MYTKEKYWENIMEYNPSKLPNWKHCQRCGRLYKGLWELLCADCRTGQYGRKTARSTDSNSDSLDTMKALRPPGGFSTE